jgi:arginyl-tRNA synthetase
LNHRFKYLCKTKELIQASIKNRIFAVYFLKIMQISELLSTEIRKALFSLYNIDEECQVQPTRKEFEGDYTFVIFGLVKTLKASPVELGNAIGNYLKANSPIVESFGLVQGFLNVSIKSSVWIQYLNSLKIDQSKHQLASKNTAVMVEYSSPNTNKPLHLGHLRNNFLGFSTAEILKAAGYTVTKTCLVNDRGIHICKSMLAYQKYGNKENPESSGLKGDHLVGKYYVAFDKAYKVEINELIEKGSTEEIAKKTAPILLEAQEMLLKWEQNDPEIVALWEKLNTWVYAGFNETYAKIGVNFDKTYYESQTYLLGKERVEEGLASGVFFQKEDNSVWIDLTDEGMDQKLVLRGDGTSVYITQDLGTTDLKFKDFNSTKSIWVVGNEQDYHFKVLFAIMKKLGRTYADGCFHLSYGMVDLPSGKMKSREGTVVDADELYAEMVAGAKELSAEKGKILELPESEQTELYKILALGALKYFLLKVEPKKRMLFNPEESIDFQGNTGPFIQYTHARIKSILRKAESLPQGEIAMNTAFEKEEKELLFILTEYKNTIQKAADEYSPALIANYAYDLAKTFNSFYAAHSVLNEADADKKAFRLTLVNEVAGTLKAAMGLLGIAVPEQM